MAQETLTAVILTALPVEFKAVREFLSDSHRVDHPHGNVYEQGTFQASHCTWNVGIVETGAGDSRAAWQTERAIEFFKPQVVLFVGVAGGLKDVDIGDVVVSMKIYGYESGKAAETFETRSKFGLSAFELVEEAKAEERSLHPAWLSRLTPQPNPLPKVRVAPIAVGEKVIASKSSDIYKFLRSNYGDALAVEMEGCGFLQAVNERQQPISAIVVRGISDLIEGKNDELNQEAESIRQKKASRHASAFAFHLLATYRPKPQDRFLLVPAVNRAVENHVWDELFNCFQDNDLSVIGRLLDEQLKTIQRDPHPELSQLDTLQKLRTVLERIDDLSIAVTWVRRIIHAFENPSEGEVQRPVSPELQAWYDARKSAQSEVEPPQKPPSYLLVALDPKDDEDTVTITAELHATDGTVSTDLLPVGAKCSVEEPAESLYQYLSEAVRKAKSVKTIEVFLSWRHFSKPVHEWEINIGLGKPKPLKLFRGTLVRSLDRITQDDWVEEWLETLKQQLVDLYKCCDNDLVQCCHVVDELDCAALENDLLLNEQRYLILKLLSVLPEEQEELEQLLSIIILSGIPIWFWFYKLPSDISTLAAAIGKLLTANNIQDSATLAEVIRKERKNLPDLGLLCDCPTRLPILVDWKNGRLRQPAA